MLFLITVVILSGLCKMHNQTNVNYHEVNVKNMLSCKTAKLTNVLSLFKVPVLSSMYKDVTVVYAIATAHKGKISAKSEDGNSLTFSILLN